MHWYGTEHLRRLTDVLRAHLPNAGIGANYSPHHGQYYLGTVHKWVKVFRRGGMTMPWSEDYIWSVPVASQQVNFINVDLFRTALKGRPEGRIHYYVMPHWPGNTPESWRRLFYGDIAHGVKIFNLFDFRPVQVTYTENYANLPRMYLEVRRALYELGLFEDIVQDGHVLRAPAALWFSETGDIWGDTADPFSTAKRTLYLAIRHLQLPLDILIEADAVAGELDQYRVVYLTERHVSRPAAQALAQWVADGGRLFATAGAGMLDEQDRPNPIMRELLGVDQTGLEHAEGTPIRFAKQDLPFAEPMDTVSWDSPRGKKAMAVFGLRSRFRADGARVIGTFAGGSPALTVNRIGRGQAIYCGFLPGLTYCKPAIPLRPVDRSTTNDCMAHFIPTAFDANAAALVGLPAEGVELPVECSEPLVASSVIRSDGGVVIPLVNWSGRPQENMEVVVKVPVPTAEVSLASGREVAGEVAEVEGGGPLAVFTFDLDIADALILR
jgi:hypothetical protein